MSVKKAEIKILTAQDLLTQLDSDQKNSEALVAEARGGEKAMTDVMKALASVMAAAKQDLEDEKVSVDDVKLVRRYLSRMQQAVTDVAKQQEASKLVAEGINQGLSRAKLRVNKIKDTEQAKLADDNDPDADNDKKPRARRAGEKPEPVKRTGQTKKSPTKKKRGPGRPRKVRPEDGGKNT